MLAKLQSSKDIENLSAFQNDRAPKTLYKNFPGLGHTFPTPRHDATPMVKACMSVVTLLSQDAYVVAFVASMMNDDGTFAAEFEKRREEYVVTMDFFKGKNNKGRLFSQYMCHAIKLVLDGNLDLVETIVEKAAGQVDTNPLAFFYTTFINEVQAQWAHLSCGAHYVHHGISIRYRDLSKYGSDLTTIPLQYIVAAINFVPSNQDKKPLIGLGLPRLPARIVFSFDDDAKHAISIDPTHNIMFGPTKNNQFFGVYEVVAVMQQENHVIWIHKDNTWYTNKGQVHSFHPEHAPPESFTNVSNIVLQRVK